MLTLCLLLAGARAVRSWRDRRQLAVELASGGVGPYGAELTSVRLDAPTRGSG